MQITDNDYNVASAILDDMAQKIREVKRPVYTQGSADIFRNFKIQAINGNCTVGAALGFGLTKQYTAIMDILTNPNSQDEERASRFADMMNYLRLGYVLSAKGEQHDKIL